MASITYIDATCVYEGALQPAVAALNLDAKLRVETRANIASLQARLGTTTLYVTHDQVEAMTMGHRVAVLRDARLQQVDAPRRLYERPANVFVAGFIGSPAMNLRPATVAADGVRLRETTIAVPESRLGGAQHEVTLGIRPESATLVASDAAEALTLTVALVEELGADAYVYGTLAGDAPDDRPFVLRCEGRQPPQIGDRVGVAIDAAAVHLFDRDSGARIG